MGYRVKMGEEKLCLSNHITYTNIQMIRCRSIMSKRPAPDLRGEVLGCVTYCSVYHHIRPWCWTRPGDGDAGTGETGMKPLGGWQQLDARYHANYPDYKTCAARHHICS